MPITLTRQRRSLNPRSWSSWDRPLQSRGSQYDALAKSEHGFEPPGRGPYTFMEDLLVGWGTGSMQFMSAFAHFLLARSCSWGFTDWV